MRKKRIHADKGWLYFLAITEQEDRYARTVRRQHLLQPRDRQGQLISPEAPESPHGPQPELNPHGPKPVHPDQIFFPFRAGSFQGPTELK